MSKLQFYLDCLFGKLTIKFPPPTADLFSQRSLFFCVGLGRSGTSFLAQLLNQVPDCYVFHEDHIDRKALVDAYINPNESSNYLLKFARHYHNLYY